MPDNTPAPNRTVEQLRAVFTPLAARLTPEVEPAAIYFPALLDGTASAPLPAVHPSTASKEGDNR